MKLLERLGLRRPAPEAKTTIDLTKHGVSLYTPAVQSGVVITTETSLQVPVALACVRLIAQGVAALELEVFSRDGDEKPVAARKRPEYRVLNRKPNRWQTSFEFREMMTARAVLTGDAFAFINRVGGKVDELMPIAARVDVVQKPDFSREYRVHLPRVGTRVYDDREIFHLPGLSWDGVRGLNIVAAAREALGLATAAEGAQAKHLGKGARPQGILTTETGLTDEAVDRIAKGWRAATTGENAYSTPILDGGVTFKQVSLSAVDAQLVETRKHQIVEICAAFGVSPAVLGVDDKTQAFASVESMQRWHLVHTLNPWLRRWTERLDHHVLDGEGPLFAKFDTNDMTKATLKERAEAYRGLIESGAMTRNEVRAREGLPPLEGLDEPLAPMNMRERADADKTA